jgi:hypothetical protein
VIGAYCRQQLPQRNASWVAQAQYQHALNRHDEFKPGAQLWAAVVQLNTQVRRRDGDAQAEPDDSGGNSCLSARAWAMRYSTGPDLWLRAKAGLSACEWHSVDSG